MTAEAAALRDKVCLVTGGGSGLGAATCRLLAEDGAVVAAADIRHRRAEDVAGEIRARGGRAAALALDVCDEAAARRAISRLVGDYGRIDVLINNAGTDVTRPFEELTLEVWDQVLGTNLRGAFIMASAVFPLMKGRRAGHIVNVVSTAAKRAWAGAAAYHASKWGLLGFSHALHVEGREAGIKVTAVISGGMRTPFLLERFPDIDVTRLQDPAHVARVIRFALAQPDETVLAEVMVLPVRETSWP